MSDLINGVPLLSLCRLLQMSGLPAALNGSTITVVRGDFKVKIEAEIPRSAQREKGHVGLVTVKTSIPDYLRDPLRDGRAELNRRALLGALTRSLPNDIELVSRLLIHRDDDAWELHEPLLAVAALCGVEGLFGAMGLSDVDEEVGTRSAWTEKDLDIVHDFLRKGAACTRGEGGITAEFSLAPGQIAAIRGDGQTALFQMDTRVLHPGVGPGLQVVVQLPDVFESGVALEARVNRLNELELEVDDGPPHFGAWCPGPSGRTVAYVSFLPNMLHRKFGIAFNFAVWSMHRAIWAAGLSNRDYAPSNTIYKPGARAPEESAVPVRAPAPATPSAATPAAPQVPANVVDSVFRALGNDGHHMRGKLVQLVLDLEKAWRATSGSQPKRLESTIRATQSAYPSVLYSRLEAALLELLKMNRIA